MANDSTTIFQDRRGCDDRRSRGHVGFAYMECRRSGDRRNVLRQYHPRPWWLQTNYVEELDPPTLNNDQES